MFSKKFRFIILASVLLITGAAQAPSKETAEKVAEPRKPVKSAPQVIRGVYFTGWSAGTESKVNYLINLRKTARVNAVVIDVKDFSGNIGYDIDLPEVKRYKAKEIKIRDIDGLIKRLHDEGFYVIARITVFEDGALAKARPDLAVKKRVKTASGGVSYVTWRDRKGLSWSDPSSKEVWDYNIAIARDALARGFDELNFDYIRFPSDGDMKSMYFSFLDKNKTKEQALKGFFRYLRQSLPNARISADIFGLVAIKKEDIGVGQILEDIYRYFDYVCPMVYPSHYYSGTLGYKNPARYPYQIVKYSIDEALKRLFELEKQYPGIKAKLRPWLQDFDLGADYDAGMVKAQIKAVYDSLGDRYNGFMLWNPSNIYTKEALQ
jgi:hypothetical protein